MNRTAVSRMNADASSVRQKTAAIGRAVSVLLLATTTTCTDAFTQRQAFLTPNHHHHHQLALPTSPSSLSLFAPPGSGYSRREDEQSVLPDTYEPMMEYPGTMRPGKTPENMPFQDLPIGDADPDPVPWPHFQQIEWHHQWEPPHEHPIPMEDFIEQNGRWATAEMEAAMRAGFRRDVRERREQAEAEKRDMIITDDDEDEEGEEPVELGDGIFGKLGSDADRALTAKATAPPKEGEVVEEEVDEAIDDGLDDFLLDLGLDAEMEADIVEPETQGDGVPPTSTSTKSADDGAGLSFDDADDDDDDDDEETISMTKDSGDGTAAITVDEDSDLDLGLDEDAEDTTTADSAPAVPAEDFSDTETLDTEDIFGEGGFDMDEFDGDAW